jgi:GNAT superfamily N-acetyltransferase
VTVEFRRAKTEDAADLAAILREWIHETPWIPKLHDAEEVQLFLLHLIGTQEVTLVDLDGCRAGFLARDAAEISALYLAPSARGKGLGGQLLDRAKAASPRLELWTFEANSGARRFYAREGFTEAYLTAGQDNEEKLPDVRMIWERGTA